MTSMRDEDIIAFAHRDWDAGLPSEIQVQRERERKNGLTDTVRIAEMLRAHVRAVQPNWPSPEERQADFEHHVRMGELLRSVRLPKPH